MTAFADIGNEVSKEFLRPQGKAYSIMLSKKPRIKNSIHAHSSACLPIINARKKTGRKDLKGSPMFICMAQQEFLIFLILF